MNCVRCMSLHRRIAFILGTLNDISARWQGVYGAFVYLHKFLTKHLKRIESMVVKDKHL